MASGFCDLFVGFGLKKYPAFQLISFGFFGCLLCFLTVIFFKSYWFLLSIYFVFGVFVACIYVSVLKVTNDDYSQEKLVAANSTFQLIGSIGALFGSLVGGILVEIFDKQGFPLAMIFSSSAYLVFAIFYQKTLNSSTRVFSNHP